MTTVPTPRPIVVGVDGSTSGTRALDWAIAEAARRHLPLQLVHARHTSSAAASPFLVAPPTPEDDPRSVVREAREHVTSRAPELVVTSTSELSSASSALVASSRVADTVVVGARGRGPIRGALLGSTSLRVATHAECPVVVVREVVPQGAHPRIVVGVDGSALSDEAVGYAFATASERHLPLTVVHAWSGEQVATLEMTVAVAKDVWAAATNQQRTRTTESIVGWAEKYPDVTVHIDVPCSSPVEALVDQSGGAELLVVGSRGLGPVRGVMLGSVSEAVLHQAHCPVAVVRPQGHSG